MSELPFSVFERMFLHQGEDDYFSANPHVAGMAAEDDQVIINPYSNLSDEQKNAVRGNEAARVYMRREGRKPEFAITDEQRQRFSGTSYGSDQQALKETLAARAFTNDPSGSPYTAEQQEFADMLRSIAKTIAQRRN